LVKRPKVRLNVRFFAVQLAHGQVELQPLLFFLFSLKGEFNEGRTLHSYLPISDILIYRNRAFLFTENLHCYLPFTSRQECGRLLKKIKFVYTPKHASWLNMAEIEINLLDHECLDRNIGNRDELERQTLVWCNANNADKRKINWSFTRYKADKKLSNYYVS
jgi:hypothetical protein